MIIMFGSQSIPAEILGLVIDDRENEKGFTKSVRAFSHHGHPILELAGEEADLFMSQYFMYANNRNRLFEMGYAQTMAYYQNMNQAVRAQQEQSLDAILAKADTTKPQ